MGRVKRRWTGLTALTAAAFLGLPLAAARAQDHTPGTIPGMGSMTTSTLKPISYTGTQGQGQAQANTAPDYESAVSFIDSAIPATQVKIRFDANYDDHRPTRAEYLFSKSGAPGDPGWWQPERNVDWQELTSYIEVAYQNMLSGFVEIPTRWVNPDVNANDWGLGDVQAGFKFAFINTQGLATSFQVRATIPTRMGPGLSTSHYSIEPAFLLFVRPLEWLALEGEVRYWLPLSGTDFAGDLVRYGLGLSFGQRSYEDFWFTPVVEAVGWTLLDGKEMVPLPGGGGIKDSGGETIVNMMAGVRFGFGDTGDIYVGYGHSLTGDAWQHQFWRLEFRVKF
jgi:hypothetical protein